MEDAISGLVIGCALWLCAHIGVVHVGVGHDDPLHISEGRRHRAQENLRALPTKTNHDFFST